MVNTGGQTYTFRSFNVDRPEQSSGVLDGGWWVAGVGSGICHPRG